MDEELHVSEAVLPVVEVGAKDAGHPLAHEKGSGFRVGKELAYIEMAMIGPSGT
ncbi:MAG: hypothetical protein VX733_10660 [Candidatus Latescibacterota bacterium]|nr:hypothetical protein [Candidatus Latescibacterota bacterium]